MWVSLRGLRMLCILDFITNFLCILGDTPCGWKFFKDIDGMLGMRPNAQALEFGIDMDDDVGQHNTQGLCFLNILTNLIFQFA